YKRGEREEGRARFKRGQDRAAEGVGDCIDCNNCVVVCPTGIDIRNGTQLECVNCTACIDACDEVMTKINLPTGLIRYASEEEISEGKKFKFTTRMLAYTVILTILIGVLISLLFMRSDVNSKFLREPGTDYKVVNESIITNEFQFNLQNKTKRTEQMHFKLSSHPNGTIDVIGLPVPLLIQPGQQIEGKAVISIPKKDISSYKEGIIIEVLDENDKVIDTYETSFAAPF
ncbi:MAG: 4Fe-4S dicluster domain-containing protein, partial [Weeksellaceae bacterium]